MPSKRKKHTNYSDTFKARAIKLAVSSDRSASHVARELGVAEKTLLGWIRATRTAQDVPTREFTGEERQELDFLRKESVRLQNDIDILRSATAYFSNLKKKG